VVGRAVSPGPGTINRTTGLTPPDPPLRSVRAPGCRGIGGLALSATRPPAVTGVYQYPALAEAIRRLTTSHSAAEPFYKTNPFAAKQEGTDRRSCRSATSNSFLNGKKPRHPNRDSIFFAST